MPLIAEKVLLKHFDSPDEIRVLSKTKLEVVHLGDISLMRVTLDPGWRWSQDLKPTVGTESCLVEHLNYVISGRMHVKSNSGEEFEAKAGDAMYLSPGHDAWVVGDEPVVALDFTGGKVFGKPA